MLGVAETRQLEIVECDPLAGPRMLRRLARVQRTAGFQVGTGHRGWEVEMRGRGSRSWVRSGSGSGSGVRVRVRGAGVR